jgi:hypothetical protein
LKDASRNRRRDDITTGERSYFKLSGKWSVQYILTWYLLLDVKPVQESQPPPKRPSILRFFVSNSNGLCVEFNLRPNTFVYELLKEVKQAFVSRRDREDYSSPKKG